MSYLKYYYTRYTHFIAYSLLLEILL